MEEHNLRIGSLRDECGVENVGAPRKKFVVRTNCEYSSVVEAASADDALVIAGKTDVGEWEKAWAPMEVEEE